MKKGWLYFRRATFFRLRLPLYFIFLLILFAFILSHPKKNRKRTKYPLQNEKKGTLLIFYLYIFFKFLIFAFFTPAIVTFFWSLYVEVLLCWAFDLFLSLIFNILPTKQKMKKEKSLTKKKLNGVKC